jgi:hypothetical protein
MKNKIASIAALLLLALTTGAQSYSIDWHKVSGGGGTSTGGVYSVNGTVGQHDADGPMTGGSYSLYGGFWSLYAVQTPGAPLLTIRLTLTNTAVVSWPSPSTGYVLQQTGSLQLPNWVIAPEAPVDNGTTVSVIANLPVGSLFFRLKH